MEMIQFKNADDVTEGSIQKKKFHTITVMPRNRETLSWNSLPGKAGEPLNYRKKYNSLLIYMHIVS